MTAYVNVFVFPCGNCNWPLATASASPLKGVSDAVLSMHEPMQCPKCSKTGLYLLADAPIRQEADWNHEIRFQSSTPDTE